MCIHQHSCLCIFELGFLKRKEPHTCQEHSEYQISIQPLQMFLPMGTLIMIASGSELRINTSGSMEEATTFHRR